MKLRFTNCLAFLTQLREGGGREERKRDREEVRGEGGREGERGREREEAVSTLQYYT